MSTPLSHPRWIERASATVAEAGCQGVKPTGWRFTAQDYQGLVLETMPFTRHAHQPGVSKSLLGLPLQEGTHVQETVLVCTKPNGELPWQLDTHFVPLAVLDAP